jgi:hypothetical protein
MKDAGVDLIPSRLICRTMLPVFLRLGPDDSFLANHQPTQPLQPDWLTRTRTGKEAHHTRPNIFAFDAASASQLQATRFAMRHGKQATSSIWGLIPTAPRCLSSALRKSKCRLREVGLLALNPSRLDSCCLFPLIFTSGHRCSARPVHEEPNSRMEIPAIRNISPG